MRMLEKTLLIGPYDLDQQAISLDEYRQRMEHFSALAIEAGAAFAIVFGDSSDFGALAYLTGFTPRLGPAYAVVPRDAVAVSLFQTGGGGMIAAGRAMTWIKALAPARDLHAGTAPLLQSLTGKGGPFVIAYAGENAIPYGWWTRFTADLPASAKLVCLDPGLDKRRESKSAAELALVVRATGIAAHVRHGLEGHLARGWTVRSAATAAERLAYRLGAQDFRILASIYDYGPPEPVDTADKTVLTDVNIRLAIRFKGYWSALGFTTGSRAHLSRRAEALLEQALLDGVLLTTALLLDVGKIEARITQALESQCKLSFSVQGIGGSLMENPALPPSQVLSVAEGGTYLIEVDITDFYGRMSISSAMVTLEGRTFKRIVPHLLL